MSVVVRPLILKYRDPKEHAVALGDVRYSSITRSPMPSTYMMPVMKIKLTPILFANGKLRTKIDCTGITSK
jgi:hypothetical protein